MIYERGTHKESESIFPNADIFIYGKFNIRGKSAKKKIKIYVLRETSGIDRSRILQILHSDLGS